MPKYYYYLPSYREYPLNNGEMTGPIIYFVQVPTLETKIGIVQNRSRLKSRLISIQTDNHEEIILIRTIPGDRFRERWLHNRYKEKGLHIRGEWFKFDPDMLTIIPPEKTIIMTNQISSEPAIHTTPEGWLY